MCSGSIEGLWLSLQYLCHKPGQTINGNFTQRLHLGHALKVCQFSAFVNFHIAKKRWCKVKNHTGYTTFLCGRLALLSQKGAWPWCRVARQWAGGRLTHFHKRRFAPYAAFILPPEAHRSTLKLAPHSASVTLIHKGRWRKGAWKLPWKGSMKGG